MKRSEQSLVFLLSGSLLSATAPTSCAAETTPSTAQPVDLATPPTAAQPAQVAQQSPEELDQLVAPIALYPDTLIAQILAAAADPTEIVEADRWLQQHSSLKGTALAQAVARSRQARRQPRCESARSCRAGRPRRGLRVGDIIVSIDEMMVAGADDRIRLLDAERIGRTVEGRVFRAERVQRVTVTPQERRA